MFVEALQSGDVVRETVNSDHQVMALLDERCELRLRTPFNIFVGGSILDRGITIPNLIAFTTVATRKPCRRTRCFSIPGCMGTAIGAT